MGSKFSICRLCKETVEEKDEKTQQTVLRGENQDTLNLGNGENENNKVDNEAPLSKPINEQIKFEEENKEAEMESKDEIYFSVEELNYLQKVFKDKPKKKTKVIESYQEGEVIGYGSFGRVVLGFNNDTGEVMAVKQVPVAQFNDPSMLDKIKALELEIDLLSCFSHPNIVRYIGTSRDKKYLNIFLEYEAGLKILFMLNYVGKGGSIAELVRKYDKFNENLIRTYTKQILQGLEYLHAHDVIHRDIKGANVLVDSKGICKLADFGGSKKIYNTEQFNSLRGTPYWMAPEVIKQSGHGRAADIWSVGCTVVEMATGKPPWSQYKDQFSAMYHIGRTESPPPFPSNLSETALDFLNQCLKINPRERANVCKLLRHPFLLMDNYPLDRGESYQWRNPRVESQTPASPSLNENTESPSTVNTHNNTDSTHDRTGSNNVGGKSTFHKTSKSNKFPISDLRKRDLSQPIEEEKKGKEEEDDDEFDFTFKFGNLKKKKEKIGHGVTGPGGLANILTSPGSIGALRRKNFKKAGSASSISKLLNKIRVKSNNDESDLPVVGEEEPPHKKRGVDKLNEILNEVALERKSEKEKERERRKKKTYQIIEENAEEGCESPINYKKRALKCVFENKESEEISSTNRNRMLDSEGDHSERQNFRLKKRINEFQSQSDTDNVFSEEKLNENKEDECEEAEEIEEDIVKDTNEDVEEEEEDEEEEEERAAEEQHQNENAKGAVKLEEEKTKDEILMNFSLTPSNSLQPEKKSLPPPTSKELEKLIFKPNSARVEYKIENQINEVEEDDKMELERCKSDKSIGKRNKLREIYKKKSDQKKDSYPSLTSFEIHDCEAENNFIIHIKSNRNFSSEEKANEKPVSSLNEKGAERIRNIVKGKQKRSSLTREYKRTINEFGDKLGNPIISERKFEDNQLILRNMNRNASKESLSEEEEINISTSPLQQLQIEKKKSFLKKQGKQEKGKKRELEMNFKYQDLNEKDCLKNKIDSPSSFGEGDTTRKAAEEEEEANTERGRNLNLYSQRNEFTHTNEDDNKLGMVTGGLELKESILDIADSKLEFSDSKSSNSSPNKKEQEQEQEQEEEHDEDTHSHEEEEEVEVMSEIVKLKNEDIEFRDAAVYANGNVLDNKAKQIQYQFQDEQVYFNALNRQNKNSQINSCKILHQFHNVNALNDDSTQTDKKLYKIAKNSLTSFPSQKQKLLFQDDSQIFSNSFTRANYEKREIHNDV